MRLMALTRADDATVGRDRVRGRSSAGRAVLVALAGVLAVSACSDLPSADADVFAGLDPVAVGDVLSSERAQQNAELMAPQYRASMWQATVGNFIFCREMLQAYVTWRDTGSPPSPPVPDAPVHPEASFVDVQEAYADLNDTIVKGDIAALRAALVNPGGCGSWVPAQAGSSNGETVADFIRATG